MNNHKILQQGLQVIGDWDFIYEDLQGNEVQRYTEKNHIKLSGLGLIASLLINEQTNDVPFYLALGTGTKPEPNEDPTLESESFRKILAAKSRQGNMVRLRFFFQSTEANGNWTEAGVFAAGTTLKDSGTIFNRLAIPISKTSNTVLTIEVRITFAAV